MKIAIIDDERPARSELRHQLSILLPDVQIDEGDSGAMALKMASENAYDLIFLDINLGDINGTALVGALHSMCPQAKIIFVTAYSQYAVEAFELGVSDYVMKPFTQKRLQKVLGRVITGKTGIKTDRSPSAETETGAAQPIISAPVIQETAETSKESEGPVFPHRIAINTGEKTIFEDIENIIYIETQGRGSLVHTNEGEYPDSRTIGDYEKKLAGCGFFRIHKSYLISLGKVREAFLWGGSSLGLKMKGYEQDVLPVSREKSKQLKKKLEG